MWITPFDNTCYISIEIAAVSKGMDLATIGWIKAMLRIRRVTARLGDTELGILK